MRNYLTLLIPLVRPYSQTFNLMKMVQKQLFFSNINGFGEGVREYDA